MPMLDSNGQRNVEAGGLPWADILPAIIGGVAHLWGQRNANQANREMAREQMDFQEGANQKQMEFQERMSNTAYQRAIQDMMDAGVNPMLAARLGGASTPGGATSGGASATMVNELSGPVSTAIQVRQMAADLEQTKVTTDLLKAELPEKQRGAEMYERTGGTVMKYIKELANPTGSILNSIVNFRRK